MKPILTRAALAAATLLAACAGGPPPVQVPAAIATAPAQTLALSVAAKGVQIYECRARAGGDGATTRHAWAFVAPEAVLFDAEGRTVGQHGAGPHWTFEDGTRLVGRVAGRAEAPQAGAIPWLLLESRTTPASGPMYAPSALNDLRHIQRVNTAGGLAPAQPCQAQEAGSRLRVPYTADYLFYSAH